MEPKDYQEVDDICEFLGIVIFIILTPIWLPCLIGHGIYVGFKKLFKRNSGHENPEKA